MFCFCAQSSGLPNFLQQPAEESFQPKNGKSGKTGKIVKGGKSRKASSGQLLLPVMTAKSSRAHEMTIEARDKAYQVYLCT